MDLLEKDNLLKIITVLKLIKKTGELDEDKYFLFQDFKWRNVLKYSILESCMKHHCQFVRLNALALISESKRSTQAFTAAELNLILLFLKYNMEEKLEFTPFIKKVLKRIDVGLVVLQRELIIEEKSLENGETSLEGEFLTIDERINMIKNTIKTYHVFISSLKELCLNNIYPGAVHCRSHSALQILILMQEFLRKELTIGLLSHSDTELLVQCIFTDSFESNKELAFTVIKQSIESNTLNLNDAKIVVELTETALNLANSMRPTDSITASFMLKMVVLSPVIEDVLLNYIASDQRQNCLTEGTMLTMIQILSNRLTNPIQLAKKNIVSACSKYSLYGYLYCIQSLLQTLDLRILQHEKAWRDLIAEIINKCYELIYIASEIVNNSSPEGHLPMDLNIQNSDSSEDSKVPLVTSQMVLLCSWRVIKEASLLLGNITSRSPIYSVESDPGLVSKEQITRIGEHFVMLLCGTKHRGAIDQAHIGFQLMCNQLFCLKDFCFKELPMTWLHYLFLDMTGLKSGNFKLCSTRRSAGVPFMVQAITCSASKKKLDYAVFHSVMRVLLKFTHLTDSDNLFADIKSMMYNNTIFCQFEENSNFTNDEDQNIKNNNVTEIKTHTLNILRALFKHYRLKDLVKPYIAEGFKAAMRSYDGQSWAERNAATLLIGTLVTRTFGVLRTRDYINLTTHNKMTGKVFFEKYAELLPFMLEHLHSFMTERNEMIDCKIQTILLIISRLYVGNDIENLNSSWQVDKFINFVSQCGTNRVHKTRELAARALVSLLTESNIGDTLKFLIKNIIVSKENSNALHGYILQLHEVVSAFQLSADILSGTNFCNFLQNMEFDILRSLEMENKNLACFPAAASFINILSELQKKASTRWFFEDQLFDNIIMRLKMHLADSNLLKKKPGKEFYETTAMDFILSCTINSFSTELFVSDNFWMSLLTHVNEDVQITSWKNIFSIVEKTNDSKLLNQAMFIAFNTNFEWIDNVEVQDAIYEFLYLTLSHLQESNVESLIVNNDSSRSEIIHQFCIAIGKILTLHMQKNYFYERGIFLQLMEKMFACFLSVSKENSANPMSRDDVYRLIVNNSWMCSADLDCRIGIAKNLYDLFIESVDTSESCLVLNWWTTLLHLLLDDNMIVRQHAFVVICDIKPKTDSGCHSRIMQVFFEKFFNIVVSKNPTVGLAALICWSITLMDDEELEMDETEVFNKSNIYEYFEPSGILKQCSSYIKLITQECGFDKIIPENVKKWLSERLNLQLCEVNTFMELIVNCKNRVPPLKGQLRDILDPFYKSKLIQHVGHEKLIQQFSKVC